MPMKLFDYRKVDITSGYVADKQEMNRKITINSVYDRFCDTGRIGAFDFNTKDVHCFWDSDVAKWIEAASYSLIYEDSPEIRAALDEVIGILEKAPCPAVLAEQCFLSNSGDYEAWATPQGCQRAARVYYEAICRYFGTQPIAQA